MRAGHVVLAHCPPNAARVVVSNEAMRLGVVLVILAACDAGQKPAPPIAKREHEIRIPEKKKVCASPGEVVEKQRAINAADRASFEAALAAQGLTALALPRVEERIGDGLRQGDLTYEPQLTAVSRKGGIYIEGITYWSQNGNPGEDPAFVVDAKHHVFAVDRQRTALAEQLVRCGCQPFECGSPCPACGQTIRILYGPLSGGSRFHGKVTIQYEGAALGTPFEAGTCPPQPCPP